MAMEIPGRDGKAGVSAELESLAEVIDASASVSKGDILVERKQGTFSRCVDKYAQASLTPYLAACSKPPLTGTQGQERK